MNQVRRLYNQLVHDVSPKYDEVCARRHGQCVVDGFNVLFDDHSAFYDSAQSPPTDSLAPPPVRCVRQDNLTAIRDAMASGLSFITATQAREEMDAAGLRLGEDQLEPEVLVSDRALRLQEADGELPGCVPGLALKLRFHLEANSSDTVQRSVLWQDSFIETMKVYQTSVIDVAFVAADSLQVLQMISMAISYNHVTQ